MQVYNNVTDDVLAPVLYGMNNNNGINDYYREKLDRMKSYVSKDSYYLENYREAEYKHSDEYINRVKRSLRDLELSGNDEDTIYYYKDTREANLRTIEYIMANKRLRNLYDRGLINGYSESGYVHNKYESEVRYMSVMDGHFSDEDDMITEYINDDMEEISNSDRNIIVANWNRALDMFNKNIDPTNK